MPKRLSAILLAVILLSSILPVGAMAANSDENNINNLIAQLPEVSDPMGTEYYYYNQLSDVEKVMYWKLYDATWENPEITISGLAGYSQEELYFLARRAVSALTADKPFKVLLWERWTVQLIAFDGDVIVFSPDRVMRTSDYMIRKSMARIEQIVAMVGMEGDTYSRARDLFDLLHQEMDYDPYYPFTSPNKGFYNGNPVGCLLYDTAVCAGFADTVKILCDELKIPCVVVGNAGHAWNFVRMDNGQWYSVDASIDAPFTDGYNMLGSQSSAYITNSNYHIGEMYIFEPGDFLFPVLSENSYEHPEGYSASYHDAELNFTEPDPTFVYAVNADGESCTIIRYEGPQNNNLIIPDQIDGYTVTAIGDAAFYRFKGFAGDLVIPDTVKEIGPCAFQACTELSGDLRLSANLEVIGAYAFLGNQSMTGELNLPETLTSIGRCAFYKCAGISGDVVLPEGIALGDEIFYGCSSLTGILYLPDSMIWDGNIVSRSGISAIQVNETNEQYATHDGLLFTKDMKTLLACPGGKTGDLVIPEGVETIARIACYYCENLNGTLTLPDGLKVIEEFAFYGANLTGDLTIPDSVETIESCAFTGTNFEGTLTLPKGLTRIEYAVFSGVPFSGDLSIPDGVTYIGDNAFSSSYFNGELHLPEGIKYIGNYAIAGNFTNSLDLSNSDVVLASNAFLDAYFDHFICNCNAEMKLAWNGRYWFYFCTYCYGAYRTTHEHYPAGETVIEPTCTEQGYTIYTCSECGESYVDSYTNALGHSWDAGTVTVEPTEETEGEMRYTCISCGATRTEVIPVLEHTHSYESVVTDPTCTEKGYTTFTCCCGDSYVDSYTDALGHKPGATVVENKVEATCETEGHYDNVVYCSVCNEELSRETVTIPATGHSFGAWQTTKEPTCTETGEKQRSCSSCGKVEKETVPAKGHSYESVVTAPTCEDKGYTIHTCTVCGDSYVDSYTDALGHKPGATVVENKVEATCETEGHYDNVVYCSVCNEELSRETVTIPATGHSFGAWQTTKEPTCTETGEKQRSCSSCGKVEKETLPAKGHSYESVVTAPTCEDRGYTIHTCIVCGDSYVDSYTDPVDHVYEDGHCKWCDEPEGGDSECTDHAYESVVTAPTCEAQGYTTYTCTKCGDSYVSDYTDPVDHVYEDGHCKWCDEGERYLRWYSGTTSLNGTIDLNIYVLLSQDLVNADDTYVRFIYDGQTVDVPMADAIHSPAAQNPNRYRFSCPIYAKQLADNVTVKFLKGDEQIGKDLNYSVMTYCVNQIKKVTDPQEVALYKAMLNYGAAAQKLFSHNLENLANASLSEADKVLPSVDASAYKYAISGKEEGIRAKSATLMLEDVVKVRVYFALTGTKTIEDYTFTIDGEEVAVQKNEKGYYVESSGIAAKDLEHMFSIQVGGITVKYGALSYVNSMANGSKELEANISRALYVYWQAAEALLG